MCDVDEDNWFAELGELENLSGRYVARALLQQQYLPNVKKTGEEFPPLFETATFSIEVAEAMKTLEPRSAVWVELRARRFDGLIRRLGVPHPVVYSRLVLHIRDHWESLATKLESPHSEIKPQWRDDGRVIQMDYADHAEEHIQHTRLAQGKQYLVKADISNCFPSIYSHALDWALRGKSVAKGDRSTASWEARVDLLARNSVNGETKGLLVGPAVSNLLSELVLQRIDENLLDHTFVRYIDDYSAYFVSHQQAEDFLVQLQRELAFYRLDLNTRKTRIVSLREGVGDAWIAQVLSHLPSEWTDLGAARFLQQCELLAQQYPAESVLKFAAKTLLVHSVRPDEGSLFVVEELTRISQFHPHLLPTLSKELDRVDGCSSTTLEQLARPLRMQLERAIRAGETDSVLWLLYIIRRQLRRGIKLTKKTASDLLNLNDDFCWLALAVLSKKGATLVQRHIGGLAYVDEADRQSHWLARYELWRVGRLTTDELSNEERAWMTVLKDKGVVFSKLESAG